MRVYAYVNKRYDDNEEKIGNSTYTYNGLLSKRRLFEKENKQTYSYHKRKWNKEVSSNSETGIKQIFAIFIDEHVALVHSVFSGSTPISISLFSWFSLLLAVHWEQPPHLSNKMPQIQKIYVRYERIILFFWHFWVISRVVGEKKKHSIKNVLLRSRKTTVAQKRV